MFKDEYQAMTNGSLGKYNLFKNNPFGYFVSAMTAGAFIGVGVMLAFTVGGLLTGQPYAKIMMAATFSVALSLVVIAGAELFTGNNMVLAAGVLRKEISAADYLAGIAAKQPGFLDLSFGTICGYGPHGAIIHYGATPETDVPLQPEGLLLVDSGRHYLEGTTDITRTIALGPVTAEMKADFTRVARANLNLMYARFLYGCSGMNLDILAREPFWEAGLDFKHGTGHGIGHVLNVHEGPNGFRWRRSPDRSEHAVLEEGMITSDEPGIYLEGKYGIRLENEILCRKGEKNEYGQFMYFENLTSVPFDLECIDPTQMDRSEIEKLNDFHAKVYEKVALYLEEEEAAWLKEATRAI